MSANWECIAEYFKESLLKRPPFATRTLRRTMCGMLQSSWLAIRANRGCWIQAGNKYCRQFNSQWVLIVNFCREFHEKSGEHDQFLLEECFVEHFLKDSILLASDPSKLRLLNMSWQHLLQTVLFSMSASWQSITEDFIESLINMTTFCF